MNSQQQIAAVKAIIKIKNKILHSSNWDDIASLIQQAIDACTGVPANITLDTLDKTNSKEWNIISLKRLISRINERSYEDVEAAYPDVAASLLKLSMVFVEGGLSEVNSILAESLMLRGILSNTKKTARKNS